MKRRASLSALVFSLAVLVGALVVRGWDPSMLVALRGAGFDTLQRIWPRSNEPPQPVRIVDIDEASLKKLGQWPWSRDQLARLVENLDNLGAAAIVFDIVFPEPDRLSPRRILDQPDIRKSFAGNLPAGALDALPDTDQEFAAAMAGKPIVTAIASAVGPTPADIPVKAGFAQTGAPATNAPPHLGTITKNLAAFDTAAAGIGNINIDLAGEQGVARQIPMLWTDGHRFFPALSVEALRVAQGVDTFLVRADADTENAVESLSVGDIHIPLSESGMFHVYYRPDDPGLYISAADVISGAEETRLRPLIDGNVVFVGTSAVGLLDVRTSALGQAVPGVSIHAQAVEQILSNQFLTRPEWIAGSEIIGVGLLSLLIIGLSQVYKPWLAMAGATAATCVVLALTVLAFRSFGLLVDATFPVLSLAAVTLASTGYRLLVTDREGRHMRRAFGHYVAPSVLNELENNPQALKLGGEVRDVTVMFVDIANFTPLGEKLPPQDLVHTINGLWDVCTTAILNQQGTIDKFIGDAVMAFWNAPVKIEHHQAKAAHAALAIRQALHDYNARPEIAELLKSKGVWPLAVRVGIASGPACVGNMGSKDRFDYSVLGETVNTAARTESACKRVACDILLAGDLAPETQKLALLPAGFVAMKGKSQSEPIHFLLGDEIMHNSPHFQTLDKEHAYIARQLSAAKNTKALGSIKQLLDELSLHNRQCENYLKAMADRREDFVAPKASPA